VDRRYCGLGRAPRAASLGRTAGPFLGFAVASWCCQRRLDPGPPEAPPPAWSPGSCFHMRSERAAATVFGTAEIAVSHTMLRSTLKYPCETRSRILRASFRLSSGRSCPVSGSSRRVCRQPLRSLRRTSMSHLGVDRSSGAFLFFSERTYFSPTRGPATYYARAAAGAAVRDVPTKDFPLQVSPLDRLK
jgi:hypothetical protein